MPYLESWRVWFYFVWFGFILFYFILFCYYIILFYFVWFCSHMALPFSCFVFLNCFNAGQENKPANMCNFDSGTSQKARSFIDIIQQPVPASPCSSMTELWQIRASFVPVSCVEWCCGPHVFQTSPSPSHYPLLDVFLSKDFGHY